jgi:hypothetical protein
MKNSTVDDCKVIQLSKIHNRAGNITIVENNIDIPFDVKRIYYLYDIPSNETRGGHAHKELYQLVIAASGSFNINLNDGVNDKTIFLNRPDFGLLIVPGIWRDLSNFSSGSVCLVFASEEYSENDYIRDYDEFINLKK